MITIKGEWFDGKTSNGTPATLSIPENGSWQIHCTADGAVIGQGETFKPNISARLANTPRYLNFAGDESFETEDNASVDEALKLLRREHWLLKVHILESKFRYVLIAVVIFLLMAFAGMKYGVPTAANLIAQQIPRSVLNTTSEQTLTIFDKAFFTPSELELEKEKQLRAFFQSALDEHPDLELEILFRKSEKIGANAFALPNGQIIFTDEMISLADDDKELMAILTHEIGHIVHRHGLRRLIQSSILSFAILSVTGDASGVSEIFLGLPVILTELGYSRRFEVEADTYAVNYLKTHSVDPKHFANILTRITMIAKNKQEDIDSPEWLNYFSTHPATQERIEIISKSEI
ncbi:MAG: M48 family metallopeptidase [Desulfotalea sp.]